MPSPKKTASELQGILAANVRKHRIQRGLSQERLAAVCGYHRTYIGSVERGERNITLSTLAALARALEVMPQALLQAFDGDA